MSKLKTFRVRFAVVDYYAIKVKSKNPVAAISEAKEIFFERFLDGYTFDIAQGGAHEWQAEEVAADKTSTQLSTNESTPQ